LSIKSAVKPENRFWIGIYGFAAFIMLLATAVFTWLVWSSKHEPGVGRVAGPRPSTTVEDSIPDERYQALAAFQAPAYKAQRGDPDGIQTAMVLYTQQDFRAAAAALRPIANAKPEIAQVRFYLGISLLQSGDRIAGIQELRELTEAAGPFQERARFYMAKGLLAEHDVRRAREQLEEVIAQHDDLEKQAAALLDQIKQS